MSDSVADWGRGTLRVVPSLVGGPQNCELFMVHLSSLFSFLHFVVLIFHDLLISIIGCPRFSLGRHQVFAVI